MQSPVGLHRDDREILAGPQRVLAELNLSAELVAAAIDFLLAPPYIASLGVA